MPSETIFLTGATGHVGTALLPALLERGGVRVLTLVRASDPDHLAARRRTLLRQAGLDEGGDNAAGADVECLQGDLSLPGLGMRSEDHQRILAEATAIVHSAASVRFDLPEDTAAEQNLESTRAVVQLARDLAERGRLRRLDHVSTCYVAGDRQGRAYEHENDEGQGFRNSYEWSKCQAEKVVRAAITEGLPAAIHRPAIVVGDSRTGHTRSFNVMYWPLKLYVKGWWRTLPGRLDARADIVPVDYVAAAMAHLRRDPATLGRCFHLAAGDAAPTIGELVARVRAITGAKPLRVVEQGPYRKWVRPLLWPFFLSKRGQAIRRGGNAFMPYFQSNPVFDTTNRDAAGGPQPPNVLDYIEQIVRYAIDSDFGQRPGPGA